MSRMVNMFDIGEKVMIEVEIADVSVKKGELKYSIKDPMTQKCFDYLYTEEQLVEVQSKPATKQTTSKSTKK